MKAKLQNPLFHAKTTLKEEKKDFYAFLEGNIKPIGTYTLLGGVGAAAIGMIPVSEYLLATGALFHLVSWFGDFWKK